MWIKSFNSEYVRLDSTSLLKITYVDLSGTENDRWEIQNGTGVALARYNTEQEAIDALESLMSTVGYVTLIGTFDS